MAIVRPSTAATGAGLYQAVRERIEEDARLHAERIAGWPADQFDHVHRPYPMQRILDALRAGELVYAPGWAIPQQALADFSAAASRLPTTFGHRMVIHPDDTFVVVADNGAGWLEDNGL
jgi:hypothetical protein